MNDCRNCSQFELCVSGKHAHETGTRYGYCADNCTDYRKGNDIQYHPVSPRSESISRSAINLDGYMNCVQGVIA